MLPALRFQLLVVHHLELLDQKTMRIVIGPLHTPQEALRDQRPRRDARRPELPVVREVNREMLLDNFQHVRDEIAALVRSELQRIGNTAELRHLLM